MSKAMCGIVLAGVIGIFSLIGILCNYFIDNKHKKLLNDFIFGLLFSSLTLIILLYLIPNIYSYLGFIHLFLVFILLVFGYLFLKLLSNYFYPYDNKLSKKEMIFNYQYIGIFLLIIFSIYNIVMGFQLYGTAIKNINNAISLTISMIVINFIIGFVMYFLVNQKSDMYKIKKFLPIYIITPIIGSITMLFLNKNINNIIIGCLNSFILGMIIFLLLTEIIIKISKCKNKKITIYGIIVGAILVGASCIL